MENAAQDEFRTIRTNTAGTEIAQQGRNSAAIRIMYMDLQVYVWLPDGHMLGYNAHNDTFMDDGDYRDIYRIVGQQPQPLRPTPERAQQIRQYNPHMQQLFA